MQKIVLHDWFGADMGEAINPGELVIAAHKAGFYSVGKTGFQLLKQDHWDWSSDKTSCHIVAYTHLTQEILGKMINWDGGECPLDFKTLTFYKDAYNDFDVEWAGCGGLADKYWAKNIMKNRVVAYLPVEFELSEHVKFEFKKNDFIESISHCSDVNQIDSVIDNFLKKG